MFIGNINFRVSKNQDLEDDSTINEYFSKVSEFNQREREFN